jgi:phage terminase small subunit
MSRKLGSHLETTKLPGKQAVGDPVKPKRLSPQAAQAWDRLLSQLRASGIELSPAHSVTLSVCSTLCADIADSWQVLQANGGNYCKAGTGAVKLHPAAARLDVLRRDLTKALALLGLQKPTPDDTEESGEPSLEDILNG